MHHRLGMLPPPYIEMFKDIELKKAVSKMVESS